MGACFQAKRLASDLDLISSSGSLPVQPGISGIGHQLTVTATAWASVMRRKAAGHLGAVSENQSHKVQCRSAVGRVGLQSTQRRRWHISSRATGPLWKRSFASQAKKAAPSDSSHSRVESINRKRRAAERLHLEAAN